MNAERPLDSTQRFAMSDIALSRGERIIAVVPEHCYGPGWSNQVVWVYIAANQEKGLRVECLQADELTPELATLFNIGAETCKALLYAVQPKVKHD